jgi:ABC-type glycerol-3-phosphate transport system substrate-binding protein
MFLERTGLGSLVVVGGLPALIAACSPAPAATSSPVPSASAAATPSSVAPSPTPVSISGKTGTLWGIAFDPHVETQTKIAEAFKEKTGATIEVQPQSGEGTADGAKILTSVAAGTAPDVACQLGATLVPLYIRNVLADVTSIFAEAGIDPATAFLGDSAQAFSWDGKLQGVPLEINSTAGVNVPTAAATAKGLNPPPLDGQDQFESFEAMWELATALTEKDASGTVTKWGLSGNTWEYGPIMSIMRTLGTDWWDPSSESFNFDSEAGIRAFQLAVEEPVKRGVEGEINVDQVTAILGGTVAMGYGQIGSALNAPRQDPPIEVELVMSPKIDGQDQSYVGDGGWGFIGLAGSKEPELVNEFLKFMASRDGQFEWAQLYGGIVSAFKEVNEDPASWINQDPEDTVAKSMKRYVSYLDRTVFMGDGFGYASPIRTAATQISSEVRQGTITAAEAATRYQEAAVEQYQNYLNDLETI